MVHPTHRVELFSNIFAASDSLGTQFVLKVWKKFEVVVSDRAS